MNYPIGKMVNSKIRVSASLDVLIAVAFIVPQMVLYLNSLLRGVFFTWPVFVSWLLVILVKKESLLPFYFLLRIRIKEFVFILIFIMVVACNYIFVDGSPKALQYLVTFINFFLILILDTYYSVRPERYKLSLLLYIILIIGIQAIVSIPYLLSAEYFVTRMYASGQLDEATTLEAIRHGVGNNGLYTSCAAIFFIGLAILQRFPFFFKLLICTSVTGILFSILVSTFFASILMVVFGLVIIIVFYNKRIFKPKITFLIMLLVLLTLGFYNQFLSETNLVIPITKKVEKFLFQENGFSARTKLAEVSFNTFSDSPLFGVGIPDWGSYNIIGEHTPWIDYFAHFGFFGFLPFLIFLFLIISKRVKLNLINPEQGFYNLACYIGLTIFILSNFISPMITVPSMYIMVVLFYASRDKAVSFEKK